MVTQPTVPRTSPQSSAVLPVNLDKGTHGMPPSGLCRNPAQCPCTEGASRLQAKRGRRGPGRGQRGRAAPPPPLVCAGPLPPPVRTLLSALLLHRAPAAARLPAPSLAGAVCLRLSLRASVTICPPAASPSPFFELPRNDFSQRNEGR